MLRTVLRTACWAAAAVVAVLSVTACGGSTPRDLNVVVVERGIARSVLVEHHIYTKVACPARIPQVQGHSFVCHALLNAGSYPIPVTQTDGNGHVRWDTAAPIVPLSMRRVVSAIHRSVLTQRGVHSVVTCPTEVLQQKGLKFNCTAVVKLGTSKVKPGSYPFVVTELDGAGHVTYAAG